jgi:hypothetical protein
MQTLWQDLRYGIRMLMRNPGFTAVAVLTLAVAIGANAVVFSALNGFILRPLNVPQAQSLYQLIRGGDKDSSESYPDYLDLRDRNRSFDGLIAYNISGAGLDTGKNPSRVWVFEVTLAGSSTAPMSMAPIAHPTSCSPMRIGTAIFRMTAAWWVALSSSTNILSPSAFGSAAGLLLGLLASRVLALIVYQATPRDPLVLAGVVLAMALLGLVATWIPAQRALSIDPAILLREE